MGKHITLEVEAKADNILERRFPGYAEYEAISVVAGIPTNKFRRLFRQESCREDCQVPLTMRKLCLSPFHICCNPF